MNHFAICEASEIIAFSANNYHLYNPLKGHAKMPEKPAFAEVTKLPVSERIADRLRALAIRFYANDHIGSVLRDGEMDELEDELTDKMAGVLSTLLIDVDNDHNTKGTPRRMARLYLREVFRGRYEPPPTLTAFPNAQRLDELYTLGPIEIRSACAHHLCPIEGRLWCGVIPGDRILGLSKFARIAEWMLARPQIQEEAIVQLADYLEDILKPRGLGVLLRARHSCMTWRGVRQNDTVMTTSVMRGIIHEGAMARGEFLTFVNGRD